MSRQKTQFPRVPLSAIKEVVERNGNGLPSKKRRAAESVVKAKQPKAIQSLARSSSAEGPYVNKSR